MPRIAASMAVLLTVAVSIGFNTARYPVVWEMVAEGRYPDQPAEPSEASPVSQSLASTDSRPSDEVGSSATRPLETVAGQPSSGTFPPSKTTRQSSASESLFESRETRPPAEDLLVGLRDLDQATAEPLAPMIQPSSASDPVIESERMTPMTAVASIEDRLADQADPGRAETNSPRQDDAMARELELAARVVSPMAVIEPAGKYAAGPSAVDAEPDDEMVPMTGLSRLEEPTGWPARGKMAADINSIAAQPPAEGEEAVRPLPPLDRVWTSPDAADQPPIPEGRIPIYPSTNARGV